MRFLALLLAIATSPALAHPGGHHAGLLFTVWHLVSDPYHLMPIAAAAAAGAVAGIHLYRYAIARTE